MNSKNLSPKFIFISSAIGIAAVSRLLPHLPNFTPVAAIALFGGAYLNDRKAAFLIPFIALILSDLFLGFSASTPAVYMCFAVTVFIGQFIRNKVSVVSVGAASMLSSVIFFLVTNLPIWYLSEGLYPATLAGTAASYTAAIPFFGYSLLGDLVYSTVLFSAFAVAQKNIPQLSKSL